MDPGALIGGNTQVTAAPGQRLVGVPLRPNFMLAYGAQDLIVGGATSDQLGSRGTANEIRGGAGNDLLHGRRGDTLDGGPGNDLIVSSGGATVIRTGAGRDKVLTSGRGNLITCAPSSHDDLIYASRGDSVSPNCHRNRSRVLFRAPPGPAPSRARAAQQAVTGDGSNGNPFTAPCDPPPAQGCTVSSFPARTLPSFWSNEFVPAYKCPATDQYLLDVDYEPFGTQLDRGVQVNGLGPVAVAMTGGSYVTGSDGTLYFTGTYTGYPYSSATNWDGPNSSYQIILHCTSDRANASHSE
jgi:hypothetical protein